MVNAHIDILIYSMGINDVTYNLTKLGNRDEDDVRN